MLLWHIFTRLDTLASAATSLVTVAHVYGSVVSVKVCVEPPLVVDRVTGPCAVGFPSFGLPERKAGRVVASGK